MSLDDARYALEVFVERLECGLEDEGLSRHERQQWEYQLKTAKAGLEQLTAHRKAVLSEVRERIDAAFVRLTDADDHYDGERVRNAVRDVLESM